MNLKKYKKLQGLQQLFHGEYRSIYVLGAFTILASVITYVLFSYTENLLKERLQERLLAIVSTAATQFKAEEIEEIRSIDDIGTKEFEHLVYQLNQIKDANNNIRYAYLMRRTNDPDILEFVADAESLKTEDELDVNNDGILQEDEMAPLPGDPFEINAYPVLKNEAFYHAAVDNDLEEDQWSVQMSAYAPIFDLTGNVTAIVGVDVEVSDFLALTRSTLLPFLLFVLFLIFLLTLLTLILVRIWNEKVKAVEELDRQKDELLSIVSHQLATPISAIKWNLEMMIDGDLGKFAKEQLKTIKSLSEISDGLSDLVSMILDVSRIQLGRVHIEQQEMDLENFFKELLDVIKPKAAEKNIELIVKLPSKYPKAMLDKRYTHMTIENILSNAVKYTPNNGSVNLSVEIRNKKLYCAIKDTGVGIPKADQVKIFGKLFRASNVRNTVDGNGFGLYVAKGAIEAQGGKIRFESEEQKGTTFFIELPLEGKK